MKQRDWPLHGTFPLVGGHEGAGIVVAKGALVKDVDIGDRVGVKWINGTCLSCSFCQSSDEPVSSLTIPRHVELIKLQLCAKATISGATLDGTFHCLAQAATVAHIPKDAPLDAIAPGKKVVGTNQFADKSQVLCAGITVYKGLKESGSRPGQTVAIVGAGGGLGAMAIQYGKAMGLQVIAIDAGDEKANMCKKFGAYAFVDFGKSSDVVKDVRAATEDGLAPHAVLLVAVNEKPFQQAAEVRGMRVIASRLFANDMGSISAPEAPSSASACLQTRS
jgi:propanol-preferring alcohol dehydrogenase